MMIKHGKFVAHLMMNECHCVYSLKVSTGAGGYIVPITIHLALIMILNIKWSISITKYFFPNLAKKKKKKKKILCVSGCMLKKIRDSRQAVVLFFVFFFCCCCLIFLMYKITHENTLNKYQRLLSSNWNEPIIK